MDDNESNDTNNASNDIDRESFASALIGQIHNSWFKILYLIVYIPYSNRIKRHFQLKTSF